MTDVMDELKLLFSSRYPIIFMRTAEEMRIKQLITALAESMDAKVCSWSITQGYVGDENVPVPKTQMLSAALEVIKKVDHNMRFVLMYDTHNLLDNTAIRHLKDIAGTFGSTTRTSLIMVGPVVKIPPELQKQVVVLDLPLPSRDVLDGITCDMVAQMKVKKETDKGIRKLMEVIEAPMDACKDAIVTAGLGLTVDEYSRATRKMMLSKQIAPRTILEEKKQIIKNTGILEYIDKVVGLDDVGGLDAFKLWLKYAKKTHEPGAREYGLQPLRGVLLVGPPGTGKSLLAKLVAKEFNQSLLMLDMSSVASKFYGETSSNIKHALNLADTLSPVTFLWDEVEKMFATGGAGEGHEETMRVMSVLLTHLEESTSPVFRVATCNNPLYLKPEMIQRFPKVFFVDLPNVLERRDIFGIKLREVSQDPKRFNLATLSEKSEGYVGREIRNTIQEAMIRTYYEGRPVETEDILDVLSGTTPLALQDKVREEIDKVREWAACNAVNASNPMGAVNGC